MNTTTSEMPQRLANLRRWNLALGFLHAVQALAILLMAGNFAITITSNFPAGPPGTRLEMPQSLFDLAIGPAVAVFLAMAAIDHLLTATIKRATYENDLARGINRFRWVEYAFSATLMLILIGSYSGVTDITAIFAVIGANVGMILFGWLQETLNPIGRSKTTMLPFWCGAFSVSLRGLRFGSTSLEPIPFPVLCMALS